MRVGGRDVQVGGHGVRVVGRDVQVGVTASELMGAASEWGSRRPSEGMVSIGTEMPTASCGNVNTSHKACK